MLRPLLRRMLLLVLVPLSANAAGYIVTALLHDLWPRQVAFLAPDTPWLAVWAGGAFFLAIFAFMMLGDGLKRRAAQGQMPASPIRTLRAVFREDNQDRPETLAAE